MKKSLSQYMNEAFANEAKVSFQDVIDELKINDYKLKKVSSKKYEFTEPIEGLLIELIDKGSNKVEKIVDAVSTGTHSYTDIMDQIADGSLNETVNESMKQVEFAQLEELLSKEDAEACRHLYPGSSAGYTSKDGKNWVDVMYTGNGIDTWAITVEMKPEFKETNIQSEL